MSFAFRRITTGLLALLFVCVFLGVQAEDTYDPTRPDKLNASQLRAQSAIVMEADSGTVAFEKNADDQRYPASTTKIMTVYLALLTRQPDEMVTVSQNALNVPEDSSKIGLMAGEQMPLIDLLYATMIASGNDGSVAIAEHVSGSEQAFVALMNEAARNMGCRSTSFVNSHGYHDPNHYSTARDLAIIAREAMKNETFQKIAMTATYTLPKTNLSGARRLAADDRVMLIQQEGDNAQFFYPYLTGIKTGRHSEAGYCFVGSASKGGLNLITVVLKTDARGRWRDTKKLSEFGFSQYITTSIEEIYRKQPKVLEITSFALDDMDLGRLTLDIRKVNTLDDTLIVPRGEEEQQQNIYKERTQVTYKRALDAPIDEGEVVGTMVYTPIDKPDEAVEYELVASRSIARRPSLAPTVAEIFALSDADPNPFPRLSPHFVLLVLSPVVAVVLLSQGIYKLLTKKRKPRVKKNIPYKTRHYR